MTPARDDRPIIVAVAGPNGAGKSTFYEAHLSRLGLRYVNADEIARALGIPTEDAARLANEFRRVLVEQRESFVFETVLSDPVGDKVEFLRRAAQSGYTVVCCFIGVDGADVAAQRVAMRTEQGGHDVPDDRIAARFPRTLENLKRAIRVLPHVLVYDNTHLAVPFRLVGEFRDGKAVALKRPLPPWFPQTA